MFNLVLLASLVIGQAGNCSNGQCSVKAYNYVPTQTRQRPVLFTKRRSHVYVVRQSHNCPCGQSCNCNPCRCNTYHQPVVRYTQSAQANCANGQCYR